MAQYCCIPGCKNGQGLSVQDKKGTPLHTFPMNRPELLDPWIKAIPLGKNWTPTRSSRICGNHFLQRDYIKRPLMTDMILKPNAVPSVFSFPEKSTETIQTDADKKDSPRVYPAKKITKRVNIEKDPLALDESDIATAETEVSASTSLRRGTRRTNILKRTLESAKTASTPAKQLRPIAARKTEEPAKLDSVEIGEIVNIIAPVPASSSADTVRRAEVIALSETATGKLMVMGRQQNKPLAKPEVPETTPLKKPNKLNFRLVTDQGKIIHEQLCRQVMEDEKAIKLTEASIAKSQKIIKQYQNKFEIFKNVYKQLGLDSLPLLDIDSDDDIDKSDDEDDDDSNAGEILIEEDIMALDPDEPFNQVHFTLAGESDDPEFNYLKKKYDNKVEEDLQLSRKLMVLRHKVFMKNRTIEELEQGFSEQPSV